MAIDNIDEGCYLSSVSSLISSSTLVKDTRQFQFQLTTLLSLIYTNWYKLVIAVLSTGTSLILTPQPGGLWSDVRVVVEFEVKFMIILQTTMLLW